MRPLDPWRAELRALIPKGFLRRDQSPRFLFASDYPRFDGAEEITRALAAAGFSAAVRGRIAHLDAGGDKYASLLSRLPVPAVTPRDETLFAYSLARRLLQSGAPPDRQSLPLLGQWMKRLEAGQAGVYAEIAACAALCQREKRPLPAAAGAIILCALEEEERGGSVSC